MFFNHITILLFFDFSPSLEGELLKGQRCSPLGFLRPHKKYPRNICMLSRPRTQTTELCEDSLLSKLERPSASKHPSVLRYLHQQICSQSGLWELCQKSSWVLEGCWWAAACAKFLMNSCKQTHSRELKQAQRCLETEPIWSALCHRLLGICALDTTAKDFLSWRRFPRSMKMSPLAIRHTLCHSQSCKDSNSHVPLRSWIVRTIQVLRVSGPSTQPEVRSNRRNRVQCKAQDDKGYRTPSYWL